MDFYYQPATIGNFPVKNEISEESGSFEATSGDLVTIKSALQECMPSAKPTLRLEYAARAFGYRTAAAMQAALKAATDDAPVVMTPLIGPLDDDRVEMLLKACPRPADAARDAAVAVARAVIASRGPMELPWDASHVRQRRHVVHPLTREREFSFLPDIAPPDLRTIFHETSHAETEDRRDSYWGEIPKGWSIQYLTPENTTAADLSRLHVGLVPPAQKPDHLPVYQRPIIETNRVCATMILKDETKNPVGFVTFTFTIAPVSEDEADRLNQEAYSNDLDQDALDYFRPKTRCDAWRGHLHIEAMGDRHAGEAAKWPKRALDAWAEDDGRIKAAFFTLMDTEMQAIAFILSRADSNDDDCSFGRFILDLTSNGSYFGETSYDEFAVTLHRILDGCAELSNGGREGRTDREIEARLCPSVYDYADGAFWDQGIANPWGEDEPDVLDDTVA